MQTTSYTLLEASHALCVTQQALKMFLRYHNLPYSHDHKGRVIISHSLMKQLMREYPQRYWYAGKDNGRDNCEQAQRHEIKMQEKTLKPLAYSGQELSLDTIPQHGTMVKIA